MRTTRRAGRLPGGVLAVMVYGAPGRTLRLALLNRGGLPDLLQHGESSWTAQCSTTFWFSIRNTCRLVAGPRASTTGAAEDRGCLRGSRV
jgi:hypothetical protein